MNSQTRFQVAHKIPHNNKDKGAKIMVQLHIFQTHSALLGDR